MKRIAIVGFGRFGKVLYRLLKDDFELIVYNRTEDLLRELNEENGVETTTSIDKIYEAEVVFFSVSIASFESVIREHKKYFSDQLLVDVLSVKVHAKNVFTTELEGTDARVLLTHPMFGPDSSKNGFAGLPIMMDKFTANEDEYSFWKEYFESKSLKVNEMTADEHDDLAANSQGVTHFVGRLLEDIKYTKTKIDTIGAKRLHEVMDVTVNDTWELFSDLQTYNPYTKEMRIRLGKSYDKLFNLLLPKTIYPNKLVFGIQGGKGSFNEQALLTYTQKHKIVDHETKYLYTTEAVLSTLHRGEIDFGQFAIENSIGGLVDESIHAMAEYKFEIVEEFAISIAHFMMIHKGAKLKEITTLMSHPQVFKQCRATLFREYQNKYELKSGEGELIDHAKVAEVMAKGDLDKSIAVLGPKVLSEIYDLEVVAENLQDDKTNNTSFLMVKR